jgi:hypothetical protein
MQICEQKFVIQYFDLSPPSIYHHKLRWTYNGAISGSNLTSTYSKTYGKIKKSWHTKAASTRGYQNVGREGILNDKQNILKSISLTTNSNRLISV